MRKALVLPIALLVSLSLSGSASALCLLAALDDEVQKADAVWFATVTDASSADQGQPGYVRLTVKLLDVLKGPGTVGESKTVSVYVGSCGPMISPEGAAKMAPSFVGKTQLFYGGLDRSGNLGQSSTIVTPQGLPEVTKYRKAAAALGVEPQPSLTGQHLIDGGGRTGPESPSVVVVASVIVAVGLGLALLVWLFMRRKKVARS